MFINKNSVKLDGINLGEYMISIKYGFHKQWGSDTGRNSLNGRYKGTLLGIFPKFTITFRPLTQEEIELLAPHFDSGFQKFTYYDVNKKKTLTLDTYSGDWELLNENIAQNNQFSLAFISTEERG